MSLRSRRTQPPGRRRRPALSRRLLDLMAGYQGRNSQLSDHGGLTIRTRNPLTVSRSEARRRTLR